MTTPPLLLSFTPINACTLIRHRHEIKITLGAKTAGTFCTTGSVCRTQNLLRSLVVKRCTTGSVCRTQSWLRSLVKRCTTCPVCRTQNLLRSLVVKRCTTDPVYHSERTGYVAKYCTVGSVYCRESTDSLLYFLSTRSVISGIALKRSSTMP